MRTKLLTGLATVALMAGAGQALAKDIKVGHMADYTGATSSVGKPYGQGVADALAHINKTGGVNGKKIDVETVDYSYEIPRAIAQYKKWLGDQVVAIQGWGTGDTEALVSFVGKDQIPYFSASYSGHLTDPTGKGTHGSKPAPYNFFYGPYSTDGCRSLVQCAA